MILRRKMKKGKKRSYSDSEVPAVAVKIATTSNSKIDEETGLEALKKRNYEEDTPHFRRLIKETITARRAVLHSDEIDRIKDVPAKYPHLKSSSLIMYELQLLKNLQNDDVCNSIDRFIEQLAVYYNIELKTEMSKAIIIQNFHNEVTLKKFAKVNEKLFTITEGEKSTKELISAERSSPTAVIYTIDDTIASRFIVADGSIKMKVDNFTVPTVIGCLIAAYYSWNVNYPVAFKNTLECLDYIIFGTSINNKFVLEKFNRKLNNVLETVPK